MSTKRTLVIGIVVIVLSFAGGVYGWFAGLPSATFRMGLALLLGANLLIGLWAWARAKPGSGDAMVAPSTVLTTVGMLVGIAPGVLWPDSDRARIAGTAISLILLTALVVMHIRRRRAAR